MKKEQRTKRHHYVPQFYLRHWCGPDGKFWVFAFGKDAPFRASPNSFAFENNLYDTSQHEGIEHWEQEKSLSRIEGHFAGVWPDVFQRARNKRTKRNLAMWLALTYLRHPNHRQTIKKVNDGWQQILAELPPDQTEVEIEHIGGSHVFNVHELTEQTKNTEKNIAAGFLRTMRHTIRSIADTFFERKWGVLVSDAPIFVTGDCPLVLWRADTTKERFGLGTPGTQITFPLSPHKMLMIDDVFEEDGMSYPLLDIGTLNVGTAKACKRVVFSATPEIFGI